jgi:hypothetical protein
MTRNLACQLLESLFYSQKVRVRDPPNLWGGLTNDEGKYFTKFYRKHHQKPIPKEYLKREVCTLGAEILMFTLSAVSNQFLSRKSTKVGRK